MADAVFAEIAENIKADPSLLKSINGVYQFNVNVAGTVKNFTVDVYVYSYFHTISLDNMSAKKYENRIMTLVLLYIFILFTVRMPLAVLRADLQPRQTALLPLKKRISLTCM